MKESLEVYITAGYPHGECQHVIEVGLEFFKDVSNLIHATRSKGQIEVSICDSNLEMRIPIKAAKELVKKIVDQFTPEEKRTLFAELDKETEIYLDEEARKAVLKKIERCLGQ